MILDFDNPEAQETFAQALNQLGATEEELRRIEIACYAKGTTLASAVLRSLFVALEYGHEPITLPVHAPCSG